MHTERLIELLFYDFFLNFYSKQGALYRGRVWIPVDSAGNKYMSRYDLEMKYSNTAKV